MSRESPRKFLETDVADGGIGLKVGSHVPKKQTSEHGSGDRSSSTQQEPAAHAAATWTSVTAFPLFERFIMQTYWKGEVSDSQAHPEPQPTPTPKVQAVSYSRQQEGSRSIMSARTCASYREHSLCKSTCLDDSWIHPQNLTPSSPKELQIELRFVRTQQGDLFPVAHIEWTLQTDASILYLEGAELSVLQLNTNERLCVRFEFLSKLRHHHKRWRFTCSHFVVDPNQEYEVTVHHLPKPIPDGDPNHQSKNFLVPGKSILPRHSLPAGLYEKEAAGGTDTSPLPQQSSGWHCQHPRTEARTGSSLAGATASTP
ncbi:hypothetical protein P7K49_003144 [Saguinus oedipus]|uniref:IL17RA/B N-terminal domain-containing protein n=1 Tax=Saguinus oedipus TaxID=9490 RepID=A0ABQ9WJC3_SAGOE|nr:hypothetical protein P7K49_003144 [Saguinus oedipus]